MSLAEWGISEQDAQRRRQAAAERSRHMRGGVRLDAYVKARWFTRRATIVWNQGPVPFV